MPTSLTSERRPTPARFAVLRRASTVAAVGALLFGGAVTMAPTASAVDSSACNSAWYYFNGRITGNNVNLRSGPGTTYSSKGLLSKGTKVYWYCYKDFGPNRWDWDYIKVLSGPHKNVKGWVRGDLFLT